MMACHPPRAREALLHLLPAALNHAIVVVIARHMIYLAGGMLAAVGTVRTVSTDNAPSPCDALSNVQCNVYTSLWPINIC